MTAFEAGRCAAILAAYDAVAGHAPNADVLAALDAVYTKVPGVTAREIVAALRARELSCPHSTVAAAPSPFVGIIFRGVIIRRSPAS